MRDDDGAASRDPTRTSEEELEMSFHALHDPVNAAAAASYLSAFYEEHPFLENPFLIQHYLIPFYFDLNTPPSGPVADVLWHILGSRGRRSEICRGLLSSGFHLTLFNLIPLAHSLQILRTVLRHTHAPAIRESLLNPPDRFVGVLRPLLAPQDDITRDAIRLLISFGNLPEYPPEFIDLVGEIAVLGMTTIRTQLCDAALQLFEVLADRSVEFSMIFFGCSQFSNFFKTVSDLGTVTNDLLNHFLLFLHAAFSNTEVAPDCGPGSLIQTTVSESLPGLRPSLLRFIRDVISTDSAAMIEWGCDVLPFLPFGPASIDLCFELGIVERLFRLAETDLPLDVVRLVFDSICSIVVPSNFQQMSALIENGFFELVERLIGEIAPISPYWVCEALLFIERMGEERPVLDWLDRLCASAPIVEAISDLTEIHEYGPDADYFVLRIDEAARSVLVRFGNRGIAEARLGR
jgi:hypothetical protein